MKTPSKHSAAYIRRTIDAAWWTFVKVAHRYDECDQAFEAECKAEKEHRAMGARWTKGQASYRLPAHYAAKLFVLQHTFEATPVPTTWLDFAGFSHRVVLCCALRDRLFAAGLFDEAFGIQTENAFNEALDTPAFMAIDYAADIAA